MTNSNTLTELLGEPYTTIISTWDIVVTPSLALNLAQLDSEQQRHSEEETIQAVLTDDNLAFIVGGFAHLQANLDEHQERFIKCTAYDSPHEAVYYLPMPLERALSGHMRTRDELDPFLWRYINSFDASDLQIAERLNEPLRTVKQARMVKDGLTQLKLKLPETWQEALELVAHEAPQMFDRSLLATYKKCV